MAIYLVEHKLYSNGSIMENKGWKLKRRFTDQELAFNFYNRMLGLFDRSKPHIVYRIVKLI